MKSGKLTIFTSYTPGAGKSYMMVENAMNRCNEGTDVMIAFLNSRHRAIDDILDNNGIDKLQSRKYSLKDIISRRPELVVMDEMGMHHMNRDEATYVYEDIKRLLDEGIDVYTSTNLKKFKKLNHLFKNISGIGVKKPIPDYFLEIAERIFFVDREPELLINDFKSGELFGERYMKTKIMNKNFSLDTLCAYRKLSKECLKKYADKTVFVERN